MVNKNPKKNAEYVRRYKSQRNRIEVWLPRGLREDLRRKVMSSGKWSSVNDFFIEVVNSTLGKKST